MQEIVLKFFLCDGPITGDGIRCLIYSYLFIECLFSGQIFPPIGNSPLQSHLLFQRTHPLFWCIQNKFSRYFLIIHNYKCLSRIVLICKIFWIFSIIGFGGVVSRLLTAIFIFILSTTITGIGKTGISHRWYVPTWTFLSLIFIKNKTFSVDFSIKTYLNENYNVEPDFIIFDSGFPSKFVQCISLYTLFAAGISKLRYSGVQWIYPENLSFHLSDPSLETYGIFPLWRHKIREILLKNPSIIFIMSTSSLLIELISIIGIFIESTRIPLVCLLYLFHFGIWLLITPNFLPQCLCYLMIIKIPLIQMDEYQGNVNEIGLFDLIILLIGLLIIISHIYSLIFEYEGWPLASVPMFSLDRSQFTHQYLIDENQFESLMKNEFRLMNGITIGGEDQFSEGPMWIRITKNNENRNLIEEICDRICVIEHAFRQSLWSAILRSKMISKQEIDDYLYQISCLLSSKDIKFIQKTDYLNIEIHFRNGWQIYSTTKSLNLKDLFLKVFSSNEDQQRICAIDHGHQLTIEQLKINAEKIALDLINEDIVGICMSPSLEFLMTLCGVILRGIPYVPIEPNLPKERIEFIKNDSQIKLILKDNFQFELIQRKENEKFQIDLKEIFCLMYTSGSTGQPKGVYLSHNALFNRLYWQWSTFPYHQNEISSFKTSISFVDSITEIFAPLFQFIPIVIIPKSILIDMFQFTHLLMMQQITRMILIPSLLTIFIDYLNNSNDIQLFHLRFLISSGETLSMDLIESFFQIKEKCFSKECCLLNLYGSTEVMGDVTYEIFQSPIDLSDKCSSEGHTSIGYPIDNMKIKLIDIDERGVGELVVKGPNVAHGYTIASDKFIRDEIDGERQFVTGDLVQMICNRLFYFGRKDNQIKIFGNRFDLSEIEFILKKYFNCHQPVVIYLQEKNEILLFLQEKEEAINLNRNSLEKYLPSYGIPSELIIVQQFPYLTSGKIDRQSLLNFVQSFDQIGISKANLNQNFFAAGGTSLNALILMNHLHRNGFHHLTLEHLLNVSTLKDLLLLSTNEKTLLQNHQYQIIPLSEVNKSDAFYLITESLIRFGEIDRLLHLNDENLKKKHREEWFDLLDQRWTFYREKSLSFGIISNEENLLGISLCNHLNDEPHLDLQRIPLLAPVFNLIENNQNELFKENRIRQPIFHNFLTVVNPNLEAKERLLVMYFLEEQILKIARENNFQSVLTANASSVTQQLAEYVFKYEINRMIQFSNGNEDQSIRISMKHLFDC